MHPGSISRFHPERTIQRSQELDMAKIGEMSKTKLTIDCVKNFQLKLDGQIDVHKLSIQTN